MNTKHFYMLKKRKLDNKYDPINLFVETYNYDVCFESEELLYTTKTDEEYTDLPPISPLECDEEEEKEEKELKILVLNKLLTGHPILLAQIQARHSSYKLKNEIRHTLYLLYQHNK